MKKKELDIYVYLLTFDFFQRHEKNVFCLIFFRNSNVVPPKSIPELCNDFD